MTPPDTPTADSEVATASDEGHAAAGATARYRSLRRWNAAMAVLHFVQATLMVLLAERVLWPVTRTRYDFDAATETIAPISVEWAEAELALLVAGFLFVSAVAHTLIATVLYPRYAEYVAREMNPYRWYEYAVSASLMIVVVAMLAGIWDVGTLVALFGLVAVMNLCGLVMERHNQTTTETDWSAYWVGVVAGVVPWITIAVAIAGSLTAAGGQVPDFVLYIYVSIFVFFNLFALVMVFQYRETWRWDDYVTVEKTYVLLSLVAKSALAWQVFFGTQTSPI